MVNDMQAGVAGEHLVCADLILQGYPAFPTGQGLPFDIAVDVDGRLIRVQVKTTRQPTNIPQRVTHIPGYIFNVRRMGKGGRKRYEERDVDVFALVALDSRSIGYVTVPQTKTTMIFRVPALAGHYLGETMVERNAEIVRLREEGLTYNQIAARCSVDRAYAHRVANGQEDIIKVGRYLHDFTFAQALDQLGLTGTT